VSVSYPALVVPPAALVLSSSNAESAYDEWAAGTAYTAGDRVLVSTETPPREYEALTASTGAAPASSPAEWLEVGWSNPHRCLNGRNSSATTRTGGLTITVTCAARVDRVVLLGIGGASSVVLSVSVGGSPVAWAEPRSGITSGDGVPVPLPTRNVSTWSDYFFAPFGARRSLLCTLSGWPALATITVTLIGSGEVSLAHLVAGRSTTLGATLMGLRSGLESYSTREFDDFGSPLLVPRISAQRIEAELIVPDGSVDKLAALRRELDAVPAVWRLDDGERDALLCYAFFEAFEIELQTHNGTYCSIDLLEMT
jgi:hypothetical protein